MTLSWLSLSSMILALSMTGLILIYALSHRRERGVRFFIPVLTCRVIFSLNVVLELYSSSLDTKLIYRNMEVTMNSIILPFLILLTLDLLGKERLLRSLRFIVFLPFVAWAALNWSNSKLHLVYNAVTLSNNQLIITKSAFAVGYSLLYLALYVLCLVGIFMYVLTIRSDIRTPGLLIVLFGSIPPAVEMLRLWRPELSPWLQPAAVYCGFTGMLMLILFYRHKLFVNVPISRNAVVETMREGMLIVNARGMIVDCNAPMMELFDQRAIRSIMNQPASPLLAAWPAWQRLTEQMKEGSVEIRVATGGEEKVYHLNVSPLRSQGKRKLGSLTVLNDITGKQRQLEHIAHLHQLQDKLFTIVSHDIRGPVALQMQLIELIENERRATGTESRETVDSLLQQVRISFGMVENLLEWFRSQRDGIVLRPEWIELSEIVEECSEQLRMNSEVKEISFTQSFDPRVHIHADRDTFSLVLRNLLSNAVKFSKAGGTVEIKASASGEDIVEIVVLDKGVGMNDEQLRELFDEERFRTSRGTSGEKGTGLGLLVSHRFVHLNGGKLWAESKLGEGSRFHMTLEGRVMT